MPAKTRTVRFFEVVERRTGLPLDSEIPWDGILDSLAHSSVRPADRTVRILGNDHHGGPWHSPPHLRMLLFSKVLESYDFPDLINKGDGSLEALQVAETHGVAQTTHVGFFPRNIVAMIRTNVTPGAGNLEHWINAMTLAENLPEISVQPLSRVSVEAKMRDIEQARGVRIRMRTTAAQSLQGSAPRLATAIDVLQQQFGSVMVEMRVYIARDGINTEESDAIMAEAAGLLALTTQGNELHGVEAAKLTYLSREREMQDDVNILSDKLAESVLVEAHDDEGHAMVRESAAVAMQRAYDVLEGDLIAAVDRDR